MTLQFSALALPIILALVAFDSLVRVYPPEVHYGCSLVGFDIASSLPGVSIHLLVAVVAECNDNLGQCPASWASRVVLKPCSLSHRSCSRSCLSCFKHDAWGLILGIRSFVVIIFSLVSLSPSSLGRRPVTPLALADNLSRYSLSPISCPVVKG